jgi:hypothetical protein
MPVPVWPSDKGFLLSDGFEDTFGNLVDRSDTDAGPAKQRRITTAAAERVAFSIKLTSAERAWLRAFFKGDAAGGAVWFEWTHPVELVTVQARFIAGEPPSYTPWKPDWLAKISLEYRF